jgi:hypothetical protein
MSRYEYQRSYYHKRLKARKVRLVAMVFAMGLVLFFAFLIYDRFKQKPIEDKKPESTTSVSANEGAQVRLFTTEFFQFQADNKWVEIPEASTKNKFVFKAKNGPLVEHQLAVYVNEIPPPSEYFGTRLVAVDVLPEGRLTNIDSVSEHCKKAAPAGAKNEPLLLKFLDVKINCNVGGTNYRVLVGVRNGTNSIEMKRPNGENATYTLVYDDVTANPSGNQIGYILPTFQTR